MLVRNLHTINELLSVLAQPTPEMQALRVLLSTEPSRRFPSRRTWERRLKTLPESLPERIGLLGRHLLGLIRPWASGGASRGARQHGAQGTRRGVAQERPGGRQGAPHLHRYRGALDQGGLARVWVFGWKLHLACTVAGVWIPLDARLTPTNEADSRLAPQLLQELPEEARFVLGDTHYNAPEVRELCESQDRILVASKHGSYPHTDAGVEVRRVFHELRSRAIENFNGQFKSIFGGNGQVPTKGWLNTARFALGAIFVYQLALLYQYEHEQDLRVGLKAFLKAA
ncbi:MAG: transposase [Rubrobacteraceae bacterium]|nr:transposase [Rubrobacteraceae bacterium]